MTPKDLSADCVADEAMGMVGGVYERFDQAIFCNF
jgi:hypothetical protein